MYGSLYLYVYLHVRCVWVAFWVGDEFQHWSIEAVIALTWTLHPMKGMCLLSKLRVASPKTLTLKFSAPLPCFPHSLIPSCPHFPLSWLTELLRIEAGGLEGCQ